MPTENDEGVLYIVATPIGNLEDITYRAVRILSEVDYVLCEDTRVTGKLLKHYEIKAKLRRYDAHSNASVQEKTIADIGSGMSVALVSDAGTPSVSDPGVLLVAHARASGVRIEVVPGASAVTAAVSLAGIAGNQFTFLGFVPHKKGRQTFFESLPDCNQPAVFFESTHRIMKTLTALVETWPEANVSVARELTKMHEEFLTGSAADIIEILENEPVKQKGEFVVIVHT